MVSLKDSRTTVSFGGGSQLRQSGKVLSGSNQNNLNLLEDSCQMTLDQTQDSFNARVPSGFKVRSSVKKCRQSGRSLKEKRAIAFLLKDRHMATELIRLYASNYELEKSQKRLKSMQTSFGNARQSFGGNFLSSTQVIKNINQTDGISVEKTPSRKHFIVSNTYISSQPRSKSPVLDLTTNENQQKFEHRRRLSASGLKRTDRPRTAI